MAAEFEPIPKIWRFHLIYTVLAFAVGTALYPHHSFLSLYLVGGFAISGIFLGLSQHQLGAHILAVAIGLATPVVLLGSLVPIHTLILFAILISALYLLRKFLF